jgi:hypothetical protein
VFVRASECVLAFAEIARARASERASNRRHEINRLSASALSNELIQRQCRASLTLMLNVSIHSEHTQSVFLFPRRLEGVIANNKQTLASVSFSEMSEKCKFERAAATDRKKFACCRRAQLRKHKVLLFISDWSAENLLGSVFCSILWYVRGLKPKNCIQSILCNRRKWFFKYLCLEMCHLETFFLFFHSKACYLQANFILFQAA